MSGQPPDRDKVTDNGAQASQDDARPYPLAADQSGRFPIRIARDGTWYYRGSPIRRIALAKLFSTVLRREPDGRFRLVTPVEQGYIEVEDAPFTAVELRITGTGEATALEFRTNFDDWVTADADHPITVLTDTDTGQPSPYIRVRDGLDALILRPVFYELAALARPVTRGGRTVLAVDSAGIRFELGEID